MSIDRWVDKENVAQKYNGIFAVQSLSCIQLCDPMDYSPSGSSVHGVLQVRLWEWVSISYPRWSSWSRDWTRISCTGRWVLYRWATREAQWNMLCCAKSLQWCPTLCNPIDWSPPSSSVHGILQVRILEWVAALHQGIFLTQGLNLHILFPALAGGFFSTCVTWEAWVCV